MFLISLPTDFKCGPSYSFALRLLLQQRHSEDVSLSIPICSCQSVSVVRCD